MSAGTSSTLEFLAGGGEMGALIRANDWSKTPLGPPESWPQSLKTCVRIVLTSRQPMFVWWGNDLINLYNDPYRAIVGGKHPWALGQSASVVWHEIWDEIGPRAETALRQNEGTYDEALLLIMERNGYSEETYYTFSYSPVPGDHGGPEGIICANTDDTQRIVGERQLRTLKDLGKNATASNTLVEAYENTIRILAGNGADFPFLALYELENDGNAARLVGKSPVDLPEKVAPAHLAFAALNGTALLSARVVESGKPEVVEKVRATFGALPSGVWSESPDCALLVPIAQSGQRSPFAVLVAGCNPYRQLDETYLGFFGLVADQIATSLTNVRAYEEERRRAEALLEIDRAKTTFFSNVSHEFRTPLTLMLGPLEEALKANGQLPALVHENLQTAHRNALRLQKLVNSLLDFSRIEAGRMQAAYLPTDLAALTIDLASSFRSAVERAGMTLSVECPSLPEAVYADREMWEKIVLNLLSNAFKYTLEGRIAVRLSAENGQAVLRVEDTGVGIPAAELPRLFERFHRVAGSRGRSFEGTGIGLSLIKELVELHGGTIEAQSEPGLGSTFTVRIPMPAPPARSTVAHEGGATLLVQKTSLAESFLSEIESLTAAPEGGLKNSSNGAPPSRATVERAGGAARILVADDNADMRAYIQRLLEPHYRVSLAPDGQVARWLVDEHRPDLVLSDVMMPVMDGLELLKTLKADPLTATIPVVLLSARAGEEASIEGYEAGADDYLVKPFSANELLARVRAQLNTAQVRQENERKLQHLFEQAPVAICILRGPEFIIELANEEQLRLWGRTAGQVLNKPHFEALPELAHPEFIAVLTGVFTSGEALKLIELPAPLHRDGRTETGYFSPNFQPVRELNGTVSGIMVVTNEVTEQVLARQRIQESEQRLQNTFRQTPVPISIVGRGPDFVYQLANDAFVELVDRPLDQLLGKSLAEAMPDVVGQGYEALLDQVATTGVPYVQYAAPVSLERDGQKQTLFFDLQYHPMRDPDGAVTGVMGLSVDVTAQVVARQRIEENEARLQRIFSQTAALILILRGPDFVVELANPVGCAIMGRTEAQLLGKPILEALPETIEFGFDALLRGVLETGQTYHGTEVRSALLRNGRLDTVYFDFVYDRLPDDGQGAGIIITATDATERVQARQSLETSQKQLQTLFEQAPVGIALLRGPEHRFELANDFYVNLVGRQRADEIVGKPLLEALPEIEGQGFDQLLTNVVQTGEPFVANEQPVQLVRNGQFETVYADFVYQPLPAPDSGVFVVVTDVTESVLARQKIEESENRLSLAVEAVELGTWEYDPRADVLTCSERAVELVGFAPGETVTQQRALEAVVEADRPRVAEAVAYALQPASGGDYNVEYSLRNYTDGQLRTIQARGRAFFDENGAPTRFIGTALDVTEQRRAERNAVFLAEIAEELASLESIGAIMHKVGAKIGAHFTVFACAFTEIDEATDTAVVNFGWNRADAPSLVGTHRISEVANDDFLEDARAGRVIVVRNAATDPRSNPETLAALGIGSYINVPFIRDGEWRFQFAIHDSTARDWRNDEVALMRELTTRIWTRLERERAEAALRESEENFRALADNISQLAWMTDADGWIFWYNQRWFDYTGTTLEEMQGWGWQAVHAPDEVERVTAKFKYHIASGESWEDTFPIRSKDGEYRWFLSRAVPIRDAAGKVLRWFGTNTDITDTKRAEAALRESDRWFRQLADSMPQIVWTARPDGYLDYYNLRWYEFIGNDLGFGDSGWLPILHPDDRQPCLDHWQRCLQTGEPYQFEFRLDDVRHPGNYRWFLVRATAFRNEHHAIIKWFGTCTDIHDQKTESERLEALVQERTEALNQANAGLQRSNLNLSQFAYVASHDLQEPLRKIQAFGDMLFKRNAAALDEAGLDRIRRMQDSAERMSGLIQDLLNYSRVSSFSETFAPVDLSEVLKAVRSDLGVAIREKSASLRFDALPVVPGDATQLRQVLQNLVSNALKFTRPGVPPVVEIRCRVVPGTEARRLSLAPDAFFYEISVSDNGIGFDETYADRIFEAFQRLHGRGDYPGTGIGLAIVRKVAENHHGGVSVSSRVGEGSEFRVYLPVGEGVTG